MSKDDPKADFSGNFTAGSMQIAGHDMTINAPTQGSIGPLSQHLADVGAIREALRTVPLTDDDRQATAAAVDTLEAELAKPEPDRSTAATALETLTTIVNAAGGLAAAGAALINPIGAIAAALGGAAAGVIKAIGR